MPAYPYYQSSNLSASIHRDNRDNIYFACSWRVCYNAEVLLNEHLHAETIFSLPLNALKCKLNNLTIRKQYVVHVTTAAGAECYYYDVTSGLIPSTYDYLYLGFSDGPIAPVDLSDPLAYGPTPREFIGMNNLIIPAVHASQIERVNTVKYDSVFVQNKLSSFINLYHRAEDTLNTPGTDYADAFTYRDTLLKDANYKIAATYFLYHVHANLSILRVEYA